MDMGSAPSGRMPGPQAEPAAGAVRAVAKSLAAGPSMREGSMRSAAEGPRVAVLLWKPGFARANVTVHPGPGDALRNCPEPEAGGCAVFALAEEAEVRRPDEWHAGDGLVFATRDAVAALSPVPFDHIGGERSTARWRLVGNLAATSVPMAPEPPEDDGEPLDDAPTAPRMLLGSDVRDPWLLGRPFAEMKIAKSLAERLAERGVVKVADALTVNEAEFNCPSIKGIRDPGDRVRKAVAREAENKDAWHRRRPTTEAADETPPESRDAARDECRRVGLVASIRLAAKRYPENGHLLPQAIGVDGDAVPLPAMAERLGRTQDQAWAQIKGLVRLADQKSGWPSCLADEIRRARDPDGCVILDQIGMYAWWADFDAMALRRAVPMIWDERFGEGPSLADEATLSEDGHVVRFNPRAEIPSPLSGNPFTPFEPPEEGAFPERAAEPPPEPSMIRRPAARPAPGSLAEAVLEQGTACAGAVFLELAWFRDDARAAAEVLDAVRQSLEARGALFLSVPAPYGLYGMPVTAEALLDGAGLNVVEEIMWSRTAMPRAASAMEMARAAAIAAATRDDGRIRRGFGRILVASPSKSLALEADPAPRGSEALGMNTNGGSTRWSAWDDDSRLPAGIATMCLRLVRARPGSLALGLNTKSDGVAKACDLAGVGFRSLANGSAPPVARVDDDERGGMPDDGDDVLGPAP